MENLPGMDVQPDPVEHAVASLPPFMQRRMAKLALRGVRFIQEAHGICAWKVELPNGAMDRFTHLAQAVNDTWLDIERPPPIAGGY